jgi:phosphate-selective porin OprO and OprP
MNWSTFGLFTLAASALTVGAAEPATSNAPPTEVRQPDQREGTTNGPGEDLAQTATGPARLEQSTHLVLDTNAIAAVAAGTNVPPTKQKSFTWKFEWRGWDGLQFEAVQKTPLKNPLQALGWQSDDSGNQPLSHLHLEQVKMSGTFGGRLEVDAATFATTGNLTGFDPGIELRRLRMLLGGDCILVLPVSYYLDLGYGSGGFYLDKSYLTFPAGRFLGSLQIGQFQSPMGLDLITSSRDITFMEPAAPLQALAPGVEAGIQIGRPVFNQRATWTLGVFAPGAGNQDYGNASQDFGSLIGRVTWLPYYHPDPDQPTANRLLHLGLSANVLYSSTSTLRYQSRPESHIAPYVIDTGDIDANGAATFGVEAAWVQGPLSVQGEFFRSVIGATNGAGDLSFYGYYLDASWYLTGESRPYNPTTGAFNRLIPRQNFKFGGSGWGAIEVAARFSHTDLSDGPVAGGRLNLLMAGVNWYLQPHVRWMFNSGVGRVWGTAQTGDMFIFQTRIGIDF